MCRHSREGGNPDTELFDSSVWAPRLLHGGDDNCAFRAAHLVNAYNSRMSNLVQIEMTCPACKIPNAVEVWSSLNVREDPELKELLLGGEVNMMECKACREVFYAEHFLLYHDPDSELLAFVYPQSYEEKQAEWEEKTRTDFLKTQN